MTRIILKGKTRHGKNRIHQHGEVWNVIGEGKFQGADAWHLQSLNKTFKVKGEKFHDGRWVLKNNDPNFEICG